MRQPTRHKHLLCCWNKLKLKLLYGCMTAKLHLEVDLTIIRLGLDLYITQRIHTSVGAFPLDDLM